MQVRSFGVWLRQSGYSAQELALALGVSRAVIYKWISGDCSPSAATLAKLEALSQGKITARSFLRSSPSDLPSGGTDEQ